MSSTFQRILGEITRALVRSVASSARSATRSRTRTKTSTSTRSRTRTTRATGSGKAARGAGPAASGSYPGDATRLPDMTYAPQPDSQPDAGEIVWAWVPYEEDHTQGKDRPVLVIGREGAWVVALALTSKDHDRDAVQEARAGRLWVDIGSGEWDSRGRGSEVRVNRLIRLDPGSVRREGAVLPRGRYEEVVAAVRAAH